MLVFETRRECDLIQNDADMPMFQHACCKTMKVYIFDLAPRGVVFAVSGDALGIEDAGGA